MPCDMGMDNCNTDETIILSNRIDDFEKKYNKDKRYEYQLIGMLCAIISEVDNLKLLDKATKNGKCRNIKDWYKYHRMQDIQRLNQDGLPNNASKHEIKLYKSIKDNT